MAQSVTQTVRIGSRPRAGSARPRPDPFGDPDRGGGGKKALIESWLSTEGSAALIIMLVLPAFPMISWLGTKIFSFRHCRRFDLSVFRPRRRLPSRVPSYPATRTVNITGNTPHRRGPTRRGSSRALRGPHPVRQFRSPGPVLAVTEGRTVRENGAQARLYGRRARPAECSALSQFKHGS